MPRKIARPLLWLLPALLVLAGCQREPEIYRDRLLVFGTLVELSLYGVSEREGRAASERLQQQMQRQHRDWNPWQPGQLADLNAALASGREGVAGPELLTLIQRARTLSETSGGLFNPAIGRLIELWGFNRADEAMPAAPPEPAALAPLLAAQPRMSDLQLTGNRVRSRNPAVQLDFGASAKGYAVDLALATLQELGVPAAIVNAGGDLRALGRPGARRWRIGIRDPRGPGVMASVELEDGESVFTSGDYERFFEHQGMRYHHILDPRTGRPARGVSSVTVIHDDATTADAAATALFIAGPREWPRVARAMGIRQVMLVDDQGRVFLSPAMAERVHFEQTPLQKTVVAP